jgi:hypothetical protein
MALPEVVSSKEWLKARLALPKSAPSAGMPAA